MGSGILSCSSSYSSVPLRGLRKGTVDRGEGFTSMHEAPWMLERSRGGWPYAGTGVLAGRAESSGMLWNEDPGACLAGGLLGD